MNENNHCQLCLRSDIPLRTTSDTAVEDLSFLDIIVSL